MTKQSLDALRAIEAFASQRPGLDFANYGDVAAYRSEYRKIARDYRDFHALLAFCYRWNVELTPDHFERAYSGA